MRVSFGEDIRSVIERLVPLFVLPWVLGRVQTINSTVSFFFSSFSFASSLCCCCRRRRHERHSILVSAIEQLASWHTHPSSAGVMASTSRP